MLQLILNSILYPLLIIRITTGLTLLFLPFLFLILFLILQKRERNRRSKLPTWKDLDAEAPKLLKKGGTLQRLQNLSNNNTTNTETKRDDDDGRNGKKTDVIIIGSGLGSLSCAAILAKAGFKVVVLEQHDIAGGSTHTFSSTSSSSSPSSSNTTNSNGYEFDVGIHYIGARLDSLWSPIRRLFSYVSDGQLEWTRMDETYDVAVDSSTGGRIGMTGSGRECRERIVDYFKNVTREAVDGQEEGGGCAMSVVKSIEEFMNRYRSQERLGCIAGQLFLLSRMLPPALTRFLYPHLKHLWLRYGARSTSELLSTECGMLAADDNNNDNNSNQDFGANEEPTNHLDGLAAVMTYCYGDYGVQPSHAPWFLHTLVSTHYRGGAFFPTGGSSSIAKTLCATIVRNGGHVYVRAPVDRILVEQEEEEKKEGSDDECRRWWWSRRKMKRRKRAVGVVVKGVRVDARVAVVSGAGFRNTFGCTDGDKRGRIPLVRPEDGGLEIRKMLQQREDGRGDDGCCFSGHKNVGDNTDFMDKTFGRKKEEDKTTKNIGREEESKEKEEDRIGGSLAMVYLFVGLDRSDKELGIRAQNIWALKDFKNHDKAMDAFLKINLPTTTTTKDDDDDISSTLPQLPAIEHFPCIFLGSASAKDSDWTRRHPHKKAAMIVLAPVRSSWFDQWAGTKTQQRGKSYQRFKNAWKDLLLEALYKHWPQTKGHVSYVDVGTPLTNDFYLGSVRGEVYALENTVERYRSLDALLALHPENTEVSGFYLTGQDSVCVGVVSALFSGWATACRISYWSCLKLLLGLVID